ncbi:MAG: type II toxin-antitoxin system Phd/YefM family antitoxin [Acidobacteriota bacterium]|nr:type II toxin-antitoxin system Phd/YefM family antitoxin [Acidobacteriota bacterium]
MTRVHPAAKTKAVSVPKRLSATKARREFADLVNRVAFSRERIVLERHGKGVMALVSVEDLELLEALEDKLDLRDARRRLADREDNSIAWEKVKAKLGV